MARHAGKKSGAAHAKEQEQDRTHQTPSRQRGPPAAAGNQGQGNAKSQADPPGRDDPPADAQQRRRVRAKHRRMPDGEILHADARRHLVVYDAVGHRPGDAEQDYREELHGRRMDSGITLLHPDVCSGCIMASYLESFQCVEELHRRIEISAHEKPPEDRQSVHSEQSPENGNIPQVDRHT